MTEEPRILGGRYQLGGTLGRGGMAEVRQARDLRLGREVAIKQLRIDLASDPTFQERFRREAQASAGLNHPNIVAVYDTGDEPDPATGVRVPFIVMELVHGSTLRDLLRTGRQIQPTKALTFTQGVLDALGYSHKAGIIHRDIKPANVMLTPEGVVKVMDFGIARAVSDTSATMTQTAAVIGTAQYLSPEQARGETVDARSDIYSAGCLLYELLTGRPPFQGDSPVSVAYQHVREAPVPPSHLDAVITPAMDNIVLKALAKDPADRYQSAHEMRSDIGRLLGGQEVHAKPVQATVAVPVVPGGTDSTRVMAAERPVVAEPEVEEHDPKRRTRLVAFLVALAVVAVGVGIFLTWRAVTGGVETVQVPIVLDRLEAEASQILLKAKLTVEVVPVSGPDDITKNRVIAQDPKGGQDVPAGTTVKITVNTGPSKATIPFQLVGQKVDAVKAQLESLGFNRVVKLADPNEPLDAKANEVTSITPAEGATISVDTPITIYFATGKSPVPNFNGMTQDEAKVAADKAGFHNYRFETEVSTAPPGQVFKQNIPLGTVVARTTKLILYVAETTPTESPSPSTSPTA
ncbi:Stk1 family PASTA domain-containing Ser/Thr kinase [Propionicimonas sp.]|uniref:Stk1 family PASTA domain-containing Ser/Thr kinase n=1 Tax=Propionicimonas sp. TaxID=1955623 RepID=UPI0025F3F692|nr:Stk1 family PASTA domain-containing Ser/Thr kinase [Propionicimonas sp.]MCG2804543.1 Stk1 family PASTA domain-containing Ser/Thr kinase [Propionicimonas sp.]